MDCLIDPMVEINSLSGIIVSLVHQILETSHVQWVITVRKDQVLQNPALKELTVVPQTGGMSLSVWLVMKGGSAMKQVRYLLVWFKY